MSAAAIRRAGKRIMAALVPYCDWGTTLVENMDARTESELVDGPVRFFDLQWLGLHVAFQFGCASTRED